jgi:amino-acid N-acetyltransferase
LFGHRIDSQLAGTVGLEHYPPLALLRSLAVRPAYRGSGIARGLVIAAEKFATSAGAYAPYLLTETAEPFFARVGYLATDRTHAPTAIATCTEFINLCPTSAHLMRKTLVS